jgi:predicted enzyme related to lactoylglutathione lyase
MREQPAPVSVVVYAKRLAAVSAFYERTLQLEQVEVEPTHVLLRRGSTEVAVVQAPESVTASVATSQPPALRTDTPLKASFLVEDFARVKEAATLTGGSLKPEETAWSWRGFLHLDGSDPEGNIVQFRVLFGSHTN